MGEEPSKRDGEGVEQIGRWQMEVSRYESDNDRIARAPPITRGCRVKDIQQLGDRRRALRQRPRRSPEAQKVKLG